MKRKLHKGLEERRIPTPLIALILKRRAVHSVLKASSFPSYNVQHKEKNTNTIERTQAPHFAIQCKEEQESTQHWLLLPCINNIKLYRG